MVTSEAGNLVESADSLAGGEWRIVLGDAFEWLENAERHSIHAVVTDPPYGLVEYTPAQLEKLRVGRGGVWRLPPAFDNAVRKPIPRFTVLNDADKTRLNAFFTRLAQLLMPALVPGGHVFIATNPLVSHLVYLPFINAGFEKRGEIVRVVQTLRGGDRPKNAHEEFPHASVMPRSSKGPSGSTNRAERDLQAEDGRTHSDSTALQRGCAARPFINEATSPWWEASRYLPTAGDETCKTQ